MSVGRPRLSDSVREERAKARNNENSRKIYYRKTDIESYFSIIKKEELLRSKILKKADANIIALNTHKTFINQGIVSLNFD